MCNNVGMEKKIYKKNENYSLRLFITIIHFIYSFYLKKIMSNSNTNNYSIRLPPIYKFGNSKGFLLKQIKKLPDTIKRYIFDFLKLELWLNEFIDTLHSRECITLNYTVLTPLIPRSLAIPAFTNLCIQKIKHFERIWELFTPFNISNADCMK